MKDEFRAFVSKRKGNGLTAEQKTRGAIKLSTRGFCAWYVYDEVISRVPRDIRVFAEIRGTVESQAAREGEAETTRAEEKKEKEEEGAMKRGNR